MAVNTIFFYLFYLKAQAVALTIADAFKIAFINYEKGKFDKSHGDSQLAQCDNKEHNQKGEAVVNNGFVDTDTSPKTTTTDHMNAPVIQVTEGTSTPATEEGFTKKMQALVKYILLACAY